MERRVLIAAALSTLVLFLYFPLLQKPSAPLAPQRRGQPAAPLPPTPQVTEEPVIPQLSESEDIAFIESETLRLEVGRETAMVRRVVLKEFDDLETGEPLEFGKTVPVLVMQIGGEVPHGSLVELTQRRARWEVVDSSGNNYHISMEIHRRNSLVTIELSSYSSIDYYSDYLPLEIISSWHKGDELGDRYNPLEISLLSEKEHQFQWKYLKYVGVQRKSRIVPRGTHLVTLTDRYFCQSLRTDPMSTRVTVLASPKGSITTKSTIRVPIESDGRVEFVTDFYLGTRDHFALKSAGFGQAFSLGFIGRIGITLLAILNFIAGITHNYGVAILLFSIMVTGALAPFTLMSMKSMKKMQELKPQIDRIMAKHKGNSQKANIEVMALYKEHKVSPLSGCLPMLLQFPVLIALFQSISHFVELRGAGFLWIKDLSLPDRLMELPVSLPILGKYVNALPIIMVVAMLFQMRMSQKQMPGSASNPMAKMMSGPMMSILFGFMFYQFPSGLVLYWLTNSIMTLVWYKVARV